MISKHFLPLPLVIFPAGTSKQDISHAQREKVLVIRAREEYQRMHILRPVIGNTLPISWQVVERAKSVEMVNRDACDSLWLGQAQVHCNSNATVFFSTKTSPEGDAPTGRAEVKFKRGSTNKSLGLSRSLYAAVNKVIRPQHSILSACGAVASGRSIRLPSESVRHASADS